MLSCESLSVENLSWYQISVYQCAQLESYMAAVVSGYDYLASLRCTGLETCSCII